MLLSATVNRDVGAYVRAPEPATFYRMHGALSGAYDIPNLAVRNRVVVTNKTPTGLVRGFGGPQVYYALERLMDRIAVGYEAQRRGFGEQFLAAVDASLAALEEFRRDLACLPGFPSAKLDALDAGITRPGDVVGTLAYMAPELLEGKPVSSGRIRDQRHGRDRHPARLDHCGPWPHLSAPTRHTRIGKAFPILEKPILRPVGTLNIHGSCPSQLRLHSPGRADRTSGARPSRHALPLRTLRSTL